MKNINLRISLGRIIFFLSLVAFLFFQINITLVPLLRRSLPVEVDDAYTYILKAEEIAKKCFLQDCPALLDLRPQLLTQSIDNSIAGERLRVYQDVFLIHHPTHSLALLVFKIAGFTYEQAYDAVSLLGKILLCAGIAYWIYTIYGYEASAIGLLLLAPIVYQGQGISAIVPGNITLGVSLTLWGMTIQKNRLLVWLFIPLLISVILGHYVGRLLAGIGIALFFFTADRPFSKTTKILILVAAFSVLSIFLVSAFVHQPEFGFASSLFYQSLPDQSDLPFPAMSFWLNAFPNHETIFLLALIGAITLRPNRLKNWAVTGVLLSAFLLAGIIWVVPGRGTQLFERAWVPFSLFLVGLIGSALASTFVLVQNKIKFIWGGYQKTRIKTLYLLGFIAATLVLGYLGVRYYLYYFNHYNLTLENMISRYDMQFNSSQANLISKNNVNNEKETVVYLDRITLYYYLANGGLDYGAVYYPAFDNTFANRARLNSYLSDVSYLAAANPIFGLQRTPDLSIRLEDYAKLDIQSISSNVLDSFQLAIANSGKEVELEIQWEGKKTTETTLITVPEEYSGWVNFVMEGMESDHVVITLTGNRGIVIRGLRLRDSQRTNWPWGVGINLTFIPTEGDSRTVEISENRIASGLPVTLEVIDDLGYTILAEITSP